MYITGRYDETDIGFEPDSLGMLNISSGQVVALPKPSTPIRVTWAAFDSAAYVKNLPREGEAIIYRVNLRTLALEATAYKDHLFSPTGRYYLHRPVLTDTLIVYQTSTNTAVDVSQLRRSARLIGWGSPTEDILLVARRPRPQGSEASRRPFRIHQPGEVNPEVTYQLYDLRAGRMRQTVSGHLGRWVGPDYQPLIRRGGDYQPLQSR